MSVEWGRGAYVLYGLDGFIRDVIFPDQHTEHHILRQSYSSINDMIPVFQRRTNRSSREGCAATVPVESSYFVLDGMVTCWYNYSHYWHEAVLLQFDVTRGWITKLRVYLHRHPEWSNYSMQESRNFILEREVFVDPGKVFLPVSSIYNRRGGNIDADEIIGETYDHCYFMECYETMFVPYSPMAAKFHVRPYLKSEWFHSNGPDCGVYFHQDSYIVSYFVHGQHVSRGKYDAYVLAYVNTLMKTTTLIKDVIHIITDLLFYCDRTRTFTGDRLNIENPPHSNKTTEQGQNGRIAQERRIRHRRHLKRIHDTDCVNLLREKIENSKR
jgi:hypothetical protein